MTNYNHEEQRKQEELMRREAAAAARIQRQTTIRALGRLLGYREGRQAARRRGR